MPNPGCKAMLAVHHMKVVAHVECIPRGQCVPALVVVGHQDVALDNSVFAIVVVFVAETFFPHFYEISL